MNISDKEILQKVIKKAKKNGYILSSNITDQWLITHNDLQSLMANSYSCFDIIFSHEFAKAFFGIIDEWATTKCTCGGQIHVLMDMHSLDCLRCKAKRDYKFHLKQMVLEIEPLKYL